MRRPQILVVVSPAPPGDMLPWLQTIPYDVTLVATFAAAKDCLTKVPDLVMTALKLGDYNGLHVALSAQTSGIPVIVLGPNDAGLENEARAMGVRYLSSAAEHDQLAYVIEDALHSLSEAQPDPRVASLAAR